MKTQLSLALMTLCLFAVTAISGCVDNPSHDAIVENNDKLDELQAQIVALQAQLNATVQEQAEFADCRMAPMHGHYIQGHAFSNESLNSEWSKAYKTAENPNEGSRDQVMLNTCEASYLICYMSAPTDSLYEYNNCVVRPSTIRSDVGSNWDGVCWGCDDYFRVFPLTPTTIQVVEVTTPEPSGGKG